MMFAPRIKGTSIKNRLKLEDGANYVGVFRGSPYTFYQHWVGGHGVICTIKQGACEACARGLDEEKASFRFRINIVAIEGGAPVARVFENGARVYDMLSGLAKDFDLSQTKVKITRNGKEKNTTYSIMPTKDFQLSAEMLAQFAGVQLNQLEESGATNEDVA